MSTRPLNLFVLPVSGGSFPVQLGLLTEWCKAHGNDLYPDIICSASGGNVASYIASAGQFTTEGIARVASLIESDMFARTWWPKHLEFMPSAALGLLNGSMFRPGYGSGELFRQIFTTSSIQNTEIWTATFNRSSGRSHLFCNRDRISAIIGSEHFESIRDLYTIEPLTYAAGDLTLLAQISKASASIPFLFEEENIQGQYFMDGGMQYASSLTPLIHEIEGLLTPLSSALVQGQNRGDVIRFREPRSFDGLRIVYYSSYDMTGYTNLDRGRTEASISLGALIHASCLTDRNHAIDLLCRAARNDDLEVVQKSYNYLTTSQLQQIITELSAFRHYLVILFPSGLPSVDITLFTGADVLNLLNSTRQEYHATVWHSS